MGVWERVFPHGMSRAERRALLWIFLLLVWAPMVALLVWGKSGVLDLLQLRREVVNLRAEIETLRKENESLKLGLRRLKTDPGAYEGPAREDLLRKKKGEIVLYLPPAGTIFKAPPPAAPSPGATPVNGATTDAPTTNAPAVGAVPGNQVLPASAPPPTESHPPPAAVSPPQPSPSGDDSQVGGGLSGR